MNKNLKRTAVWLPLVVAVAFIAGLFAGGRFGIPPEADSKIGKLNTLLDLIAVDYVDEVDTDSLLEASIPDILSKLDPHSVYIPASELQGVNEELDGSFSGIGIEFNMLTDTIAVLSVISGGPSEKVGLLAGDRIISIDDSIVAGRKVPQADILKALRGPKGTKVKLGVMRTNTPKLLTYEVTRGDIPVSSIDAKYMIDPKTGYVKVNKFGRNTYMEFLTALVDLRGGGAEGYIIDLRGNTGGILEGAVMMANEFLEPGREVVSMRGRIPDSERTFGSDGLGSFQNEPIVLLIDEYSASSSEIFAGAIQDNDRGLIVGRRSFGKGLVQQQMDLPDSSAVRLTIARYYTPSGRCIQKTYAGGTDNYEMDLIDRFNRGESFSADSIHLDKSRTFITAGGRQVYGGGGIMPDIFVPNDTTGLSTYYINVANAGLLHRYSFNYTDLNREQLNTAGSVAELLDMLPPDDTLLTSFAFYAQREGGITPRWYYINISRDLIVNQLKALIARDVLGTSAYFEVMNASDPTVVRALEAMRNGESGDLIASPTD